MPLLRYQIRAEYGLADPELYTTADKDDPEALLEGVAMAGLVGVLRQLGDLAEFAADIFNGLHEEVMVTSARGHSLMLRVQQLEAEIPALEKAFLAQASQPPLDSEAGVEWHPNPQIDHNLFTQGGDMPRFILNSYEECRGPPKLFMLDRFDVAGAGACLKRYSDPSFFKTDFASSGDMEPELQRERKPRKAKRKGIRTRNDEDVISVAMPDANGRFPSSSEKVAHNMPAKRVKLKSRGSSNLSFISARCFMESLFESHSFAENTEDSSFTSETADNSHPIREVHEVMNNFKNNPQFQNHTRNSNLENAMDEDINNSSRQKLGGYTTHLSGVPFKEEILSSAEIKGNKAEEADTCNDTERYTFSKLEKENPLADAESVSDSSVDIYVSDDVASELDNYVDALNTLDSEAETDNENKVKLHDTKSNVAPEVLTLDKDAERRTLHVKSLSSNLCQISDKELYYDGVPKKKVSRSMDSIGDSINLKPHYQKAEDHSLDHGKTETHSADLSDDRRMRPNGDESNLLGVLKEADMMKEETIKNGDYRDNAYIKPCSTDDDGGNFKVEPKSSVSHFNTRPVFKQVSSVQDPNNASEHAHSSTDSNLDIIHDTSRKSSEFKKVSNGLCDVEPQPFHAHSDSQSNIEQHPFVISLLNTVMNSVSSSEASPKSGTSLQESLGRIHLNDDHACEVSSTSVNHFEVVEKNGDVDNKKDLMDLCPTEISVVSSKLSSPRSAVVVPTKVVIDNVTNQGECISDVGTEAGISSYIPQDNKNRNAFAVDDINFMSTIVGKESNQSGDELAESSTRSAVVCPEPANNIYHGLSEDFSIGSVVDMPSNEDDSICLEFTVRNANSVLSESRNELELDGFSQVDSLSNHLQHQLPVENAASSTIQTSSYVEDMIPPLHKELWHDSHADEVRDESCPVTDHLELSPFSKKLDGHKNDVSVVILTEEVTMDTEVDSENVTLPSIQEPHSTESTYEDGSIVDDKISCKEETLRFGSSSPESSVTLVTPNMQYSQKDEVESPGNHSIDNKKRMDLSDAPDVSALDHISQTQSLCPEVGAIRDIRKACRSPEVDDEEASRLDDLKISDEKVSYPSTLGFPDVLLPEPSTTLVLSEQNSEESTPVGDPMCFKESAGELTASSVTNQHETNEVAAAQCNYSDYFSLKPESAFNNKDLKITKVADKVEDNSELNTPFSSDCFHSGIVSSTCGLDDFEQTEVDKSATANDDRHPDDFVDETSELAASQCENPGSSTPSGLETTWGSPSEQCTRYEHPLDVAHTFENLSISDKHTDLSDFSSNKASLDLTNDIIRGLETSPDNTAAISNTTIEPAYVSCETRVSLKSSPEFGERFIYGDEDRLTSQSLVPNYNGFLKSSEEQSNEGVSKVPVETASSMGLLVNNSVLTKASEALIESELAGFQIPSQNTLQCREVSPEAPPLPPLPPLQWRVGKLRPESSFPSDFHVHEKLLPGRDVLPPLPFPESLLGYSVATNEQPVNPFGLAPPTLRNAKSLPSVSEGTTLLPISLVEGILPVDDRKPVLSQVAPQEGVTLPVNSFMAMPGFTNPSSLFSTHHEGQIQPFKPSMPDPMSGHINCSTDVQDSNEEVLKASNPFLSTANGDDLMYQYAYNPYAVYGVEGMHVLNASMPLPTQNLMPHHFLVHRGDHIYNPYSIPLAPMDVEIPNGRHHSILNRPRDPLIEAVASHDKSTLRKVPAKAQASAKPDKEGTNALLEQIRERSVKLKPTVTPRSKLNIKGPPANLKVAAILEKANALRRVCAGSDEDEDWQE